MTHPDKPHAQAGAAGGFLERLREWWARGTDLSHCDSAERDRIAAEFRMTTRELEDLVARGSHASDLLYQRMAVLGLARVDVDRVAHGLMQDLEKTCSCCSYKGACDVDLHSRPGDPAWKNYCPNAISLEAIKDPKDRVTS